MQNAKNRKWTINAFAGFVKSLGPISIYVNDRTSMATAGWVLHGSMLKCSEVYFFQYYFQVNTYSICCKCDKDYCALDFWGENGYQRMWGRKSWKAEQFLFILLDFFFSIRIINQWVKCSTSIVFQVFVHIHYSLYKHVERGGTKADCLAF